MSIKTAVWQEATRKVKKEEKNALNRAKTDEEKRKNQLRAQRGTETKKPVGSGIGAAVTGSGGSGIGVGAAIQGVVQGPRETAKSGGSQQQEYAWQRKYAGKSSTELQNIALGLDDGAEKKWVNGYAAYMDEEEKAAYDLEAGQAEIDAMEEQLALLYRQKNSGNVVANAHFGTVYPEVPDRAGLQKQIRDLEKQIAAKKAYFNQAKYIQEGRALAAVAGNDDFSQYSGYVSTADAQGGGGDETYEWINNQNGYRERYEAEYENTHRNRSQGTSAGYGAIRQSGYDVPVTESEYEKKGYDHLNEQEIAIYNYYYATEGKEAAQRYLDSIQEELNKRKAGAIYEGMAGNTAVQIVYGGAVGFDQFNSGMKNVFNFRDDYIPVSADQYAGGMIREDLKDAGPKLPDWMGGASLGQAAYDVVNTSANMAPSILASAAVGLINPVAGKWVGSTLMGMSAAGNAYQQALRDGYGKGEARVYSTMVGASELVMEKFVGGIEGFGGNAAGRFFVRNMNATDNALKMIAKQIGSMASEFTEEYLQEVLDPVLQNVFLDTDHEVEYISPEAVYAGVLGALTAAVMQGPSHVGGAVRTTGSEKNPVAAGTGIQRLAPVGKNPSPEAVANRMAEVTDESTDAFTMGELFGELGGELTRQNVSDITEALIEEGMDERTARKNARILWYVVKKGPVSALQTAMIEKNDVLAKVMREVVIDPYCTVDPKSIGYNEILRQLARETVARNSGRGWNTAAARKENGGKVGSDGETIKIIEGIDGISAEDAGEILRILKAEPGEGYAGPRGAREAYLYGFQGRSAEDLESRGGFARMLTETQRKEIYEIGKKAGGWQAEGKTDVSHNEAKCHSMRDIEIERNYIDYKDFKKIDAVIEEKVTDLTARKKVTKLQPGTIRNYTDAVNWNDRKAVRRLLKGILNPHIGKSVSFEVEGQIATAYLTRDGIDHSVGGLSSPQKAAAFDAFSGLVKNAEYIYSTENDRHSNENKRIGGRIDWDCFVSVAMNGDEAYPVVFKIRTIDQDLRSQIYEIFVKKETGYSRGGGYAEAQADAQPSYGVTPISEDRLSRQGEEVNKEMPGQKPNGTGIAGKSESNGNSQNLSERQAENLTVEEFPKHDRIGIVKFNTTADPMREVTGAGLTSHPKEISRILSELKAFKVEVIHRGSSMAYAPALSPGMAGQFMIDEEASYSAWMHEYKHFCDDRDDGFLGMRVFQNTEKCIKREIDAYDVEIELARQAGRLDIVDRLEALKAKEVSRFERNAETD